MGMRPGKPGATGIRAQEFKGLLYKSSLLLRPRSEDKVCHSVFLKRGVMGPEASEGLWLLGGLPTMSCRVLTLRAPGPCLSSWPSWMEPEPGVGPSE